MKRLLWVSLLAASSAWAQNPAPFFSQDFSAGGPLSPHLTLKYTSPSSGGFVQGGYQLNLPDSQQFNTWNTVDDCARLYFEAGHASDFAVQTHLVGNTYNGGNASMGIIIYWSPTDMVQFGPFQNKLRAEGPAIGGTDALTSGGPWRDIYLRAEVSGTFCRFRYSFDAQNWITVAAYNRALPTEVGIFCKTWENRQIATTFADLIYEPFTETLTPPTANSYWTGPNDGTPGLWTNTGNWSAGVVPGDSNESRFSGNDVDFTVVFPSEGLTESSRTFTKWFGDNPQNGPSRLAFDTRGTFWLKDEAPYGGRSAGSAFQIWGGNDKDVLTFSATPQAQFLMSDALWTVTSSPDATTNTLECGYANFYDPAGSWNGSTLFLASSDGHDYVLIFKDGTRTRLPGINYRGYGGKNLFRFEGGMHEIFGEVNLKWDWNDRHAPCEIELVGGTELSQWGAFRIGRASGDGGGVLTIDDGSTLTHDGGELVVGQDRNGTVNLLNGGVLDHISWNAFLGSASTAKGVMNVAGGIYNQRYNVFVVGRSGLGTLNLSSGEVHIRDQFIMGDQGGGYGIMNVSGGTFNHYAGRSDIGRVPNGVGEINVSGGTLNFYSGDWFWVGRDGATGKITVSGGELNNYDSHVMLGCGVSGGVGGNGTLTVEGGTFTAAAGGNYRHIYLGYNGGTGTLNLKGGVLEAIKINTGPDDWETNQTVSYGTLLGDGGTWRIAPHAPGFLAMHGITSATLTDKGLTIDVGFTDAIIRQDFADALDSSEDPYDGRLIKKGLAALIYGGASTHAWTEIIEGTLRLEASAVPGRGVLATNNAAFSLAGACDGVALDALVLGDSDSSGSLIIDQGDIITVAENGLLIENGILYLTDAEVSVKTPFLVVGGETNATVCANLRIGNPAPGWEYTFEADYDSLENETTLSITGVEALRYVWSGATLDTLWNTSGNWTNNAVPTAGDVAELTTGSGVTETVDLGNTGGVAQALFLQSLDSASSFLLTGSGALAVGTGIFALSGTNTVDAPVALDGEAVDVRVGADALLTLAGPISGGRLSYQGYGGLVTNSTFFLNNDNPNIIRLHVVSGNGALALSGANTFTGGLSVAGGRLTAWGVDALGQTSPDPESITLKSGTLAFRNLTGEPETLNSGFLSNSEDVLKPATIETLAPLTFANGDYLGYGGPFMKRGFAPLSFEIAAGQHVVFAPGVGCERLSNWGHLIEFLDDGSAPMFWQSQNLQTPQGDPKVSLTEPQGYLGLNVAEGTLRFAGQGETSTVDMRGTGVLVAMDVMNGDNSVPVALVLEDCAVDNTGGRLQLGASNMHADYRWDNVQLAMTNASFKTTNFRPRHRDMRYDFNGWLLLDNSVLDVSNMYDFAVGWGITIRIRATNNSRVGGRNQISREGQLDFLFDNSTFGPFNDFNLEGGVGGTVRFQNNARMSVKNFAAQNFDGANGPLTFTFDKATFATQTDNYREVCFPRAAAYRGNPGNPANLVFEAAEGGMTLEVNNPRWGFLVPITGIGTLTKTGPGTLGLKVRGHGNHENWNEPIAPANYDYYSVFPPSDYAATDIQTGGMVITSNSVVQTMPFTIREGAWLSLNNAEVTLGSVAGGGAIRDGTLDSVYQFDRHAGLLAFQNVATAPGFTVKFDRAANGALPPRRFPVATYSGTPPAVEHWKADKTTATFTADGGTIYATVQMSTLILIK